jgi:hypothetical protein
VPKSYVCPHCDRVNFLDSDQSTSHPARAIGRVPDSFDENAQQPEDPHVLKRSEHEKRKEALQWKIEIAALNAQLGKVKASSEFKKEKSAREKLEASFSEHDAHVMGAHIVAKEQRAKNAEQYKDDPGLLGMANESIARWLEDQL